MITSLTNKTVKDIAKLKQKKHRDETGRFLIDGMHMCEEALKAGVVDTMITTDEHYVSDHPVIYVNDAVMAKLSFTQTPQKLMAVCHKQEVLCDDPKRVLMMDGVQDPGNMGTMIRSAVAFGYDQIILSDDCVDVYNDKVLRSTQGALFHISLRRDDLKKSIRYYQKQGMTIYGTSLRDAITLAQAPVEKRLGFIVGNEGQGMREEILAMCDQALYIPIEQMESLNVAVAAGIVMYHFSGGR